MSAAPRSPSSATMRLSRVPREALLPATITKILRPDAISCPLGIMAQTCSCARPCGRCERNVGGLAHAVAMTDPQILSWLDQEDARLAQTIRKHGWAIEFISGCDPGD